MDPDFWHERWNENRIGFHQTKPNQLLEAHLSALDLPRGDRVFVPLCGKTLDIAWLLAQGHHVAGAELSEIAIRGLFEELGVSPKITEAGRLKHFYAEHIDVFVGDIFDVTAESIGVIDAVFDRAALVALPPEMRVRYAAHLAMITQQAPQLLITFDYDQDAMPGPPFAVPDAEVHERYAGAYNLSKLASVDVEGGLKGMCPALETLWHLQPKA